MMNSTRIFLITILISISTAFGLNTSITLNAPVDDNGIKSYTADEAQRIFFEHFNIELTTTNKDILSRIIIGTVSDNSILNKLVKEGFIEPIDKAQGYSIRCAPTDEQCSKWTLAVVGVDSNGVLYGLRDLGALLSQKLLSG